MGTLKFSVSAFRQLDVRLLEKMKLNCQVFKEEISMVHLNRQVAHLQSALRESCIEVLFVKIRTDHAFRVYHLHTVREFT